jgi:hypothetical protein
VEDDGNVNFNETTIDSGNDMNHVAANDDVAAVAVSDDETQLSEEEILQREEWHSMHGTSMMKEMEEMLVQTPMLCKHQC